MADFLATESIIQTVSTEAEFNSAIALVNSGQIQTIDVVGSFTLSADTTPIQKNAEIRSSTDSEIHDGGFSVIRVENGAQVMFSVRAKGTGTSHVDGPNGTALMGIAGGSLANVFANNGLFHIPPGEMFSTEAVSITNFAELKLGGRLFNEGEVSVSSESLVIVENRPQDKSVRDSMVEHYKTAEPAMGALTMEYQSETFMTIPADTVVIVGKTTIDTLSKVSSDGTGTVWSADTIKVSGNNFQDPGEIVGTNVNKIELINSGRFCGKTSATYPHGVFEGNTADTVINTSGDFQMGTMGSCSVKHYKQTGGDLRFVIDNFKGRTAHLTLWESVDVSGGTLEIIAGLFYIPDGTKSTVSTLITAPGSSAGLQELAQRVAFKGFHEIEPNEHLTLTPSVEVAGDRLNLVLTVVEH
ncbi:hypothetical protein WNZ15_07090 [Roseibium sp. AS2]|uniref:hypothetical protein n=1 Tax=Roseibium sp. AS2 TaxID=3135781 RepID=UPI0031765F17